MEQTGEQGVFASDYSEAPAGNVPCRIEVGMGTLPTIVAGEVIFAANTDMQAVCTGLGRVARIDIHDPDASTSRLVLNELLQLVERPRVQFAPLPFAEPTPIPNALEAFKDDGQPMLFGKGNKLLADLVVDPFLVTSLPTGKPFECPATRLARGFAAGVCLRLQRRSYISAMLAVVGKILPLKLVSCGISGDMAQPEINTEGGVNIRVLGRFGCVLFYLNVKVKTILPSSLECRTGGLLSSECLPLKVAKSQREDTTPVQQAQADRLARQVQFEDAGVIVDAGGLELAMPRLGIGQSGRNPSNSTDRQISRQAKLFAHVAVAAFVQIILAMLFMPIAPISHKVTGLGKRFKRRLKARRCLWWNNQLAREGSDRFHTSKLV